MTTHVRILGSLSLARCMACLTFGFICATALPGCGKTEFESRWRDRDITIDGRTADWGDALVSIKDRAIEVGALNDDRDLYLCLVAGTRNDQIQIMARGLTVWFDSKGGEQKTLGIRFPLGFARPGMPRDAGTRPQEMGLEELWRRVAAESELEILGPDGRVRERLPITAARRIEARVANEDYALVYELRVPLGPGADQPYAIGAGTGKIGVGLETPAFERPSGSGRGGGPGRGGPGGDMGRPGGRGGPGGGPGGSGMGGRGLGQRPEPPEPLKIRATILLTDPPRVRPPADPNP